MSERKATDIILELEHKVGLILNYLKVMDTNMKLLLSRTNTSNNFIPVAKPPIPQSPAITPNRQVEAPGPPQVTVESFVQVPGSKEKKTIPPISVDVNAKKGTVFQKISYGSDNKNVILATVRIYDLQNILIGETKTGMTGDWKMNLRPGKYKVHLIKAGTKQPPRPPINVKYDINIIDNKLTELDKITI